MLNSGGDYETGNTCYDESSNDSRFASQYLFSEKRNLLSKSTNKNWMKFTVLYSALIIVFTILITCCIFIASQQILNGNINKKSKLFEIDKELIKDNEITRSDLGLEIDIFDHPENHLLQDFKTNCFPPNSLDDISFRTRRGKQILYKRSVPNLLEQVTKANIVWRSINSNPSAQFSVGHSSMNVLQNLPDSNKYNETSKDLENKDESAEKSFRVESTREEEPEEDYDEKIDPKNRNGFKLSEDEINPETVIEEKDIGMNKELNTNIVDNQTVVKGLEISTVRHTFWKGEGGDLLTIRTAQAKLMKQYMDETADPCQDFYQYACGNWARHNPIPKDKAAFDTFEVLRESLDNILKELLEEEIFDNDNESYIKTKNLYKSCVNYDILEARGAEPLLDLLDKLGGWEILMPNGTWDESQFDWLWLMAQLRLFNNDILLTEWVGPDMKNSDEYVIQFDQTSLGLPIRDYYLQPSNAIYLESYRTYLTKIAILLGADDQKAKQEAKSIVNFEVELAKITSGPDERRNVSELYQRLTISSLSILIPEVDWKRYLEIVLDRQTNDTENVVIFALRYVEDLVVLLNDTEPKTIANYLLWRFVRHRANNLDDRFQEAKQKFYFTLFGREKSPPRWKNCVAQVNSNMGMAVGAMFVSKYFDENSKNDTLIMTKEIQQSFHEILSMTNWIDLLTKTLASEKIDAMSLRIGYPDYILNVEKLNERYKDVIVEADKYFENTLNILRHLTKVEQNHLGTAVNKTGWNTPPAVVNAYYSRNKNQIMFPAGILQPPFYHRYFPKSLNYGGIGVVIGHEITHGFDDKGRLFDKHGNLHRWWSEESIENFHERALCIIEQYSKYIVTEVGMKIDGTNTQGENIADNGGIKQAFRAYKKWILENGEDDESLPGLNITGMQLFYLNFAQVWCGDTRPAASRNKLKTAVHSPGRFRVIGTLSNSDDFSLVFNCPPDSPMNPVNKCSVW